VAPGLAIPGPEYDVGQVERLAGLMPLGRLPTSAQVADAVAFLARAEAVTGQILFVDGGAALESYPRDFAYMER
jgi:NAD(P)-dependent dehydrogenase (short-subunit alcohol dehydrogenase family)